MENKVRQELWCHECDQYVQFDMDMSLNGNHECVCPNCGHIHYRVVRQGEITEERYRSSAGQIISATNITSSDTSTFGLYAGTAANTATFYNDSSSIQRNYLMYQSWMNASTS